MLQEKKLKTQSKTISPFAKKFFYAILIFIAAVYFYSCSKIKNQDESLNQDFSEFEFNGKKLHGKKNPNEFAKCFCIYEYENNYSLIDIYRKEKYLLVPKEEYSDDLNKIKKSYGLNAVIQRGAKNIYLASSSAYSLWAALSAQDNIGFSSIKEDDWYIEQARSSMKEGKVVYAGKYRKPDYELLIKSKCPLAIESTMILHVPKVKEKLEQLGISVFTDYSSYENNPLGRLEWIKVYAELADCRETAKDFFNTQVELLQKNISDLRPKEENSSSKIQVAKYSSSYFYVNTRGMAVVRSPENYISNMLKLASCDYLCPQLKKDSNFKSRPTLCVSMEEFYRACKSADFLFYDGNIDSSCESLSVLKEKNPLVAKFDAVKNGNVWVAKKMIYQDTAEICKIILDMNKIFCNKSEDEIFFFERLK